MNKQIFRLGVGLMVAYLVLFAQLNNLQFFRAEGLTTHASNSRPLVADFGAARGEIRAADGTVLARSVDLDDGAFERRREYPTGELFAEVTGFFSFDSGADGLEQTWDEELRGDRNQLEDGLRELLGGESTTADVNTTLSVEIQTAARDALGDRRGSVVVLDPQSGAILSLWSWPSYDPNPLASTVSSEARAARSTLLADPLNPLLPRTTRELFFPGSTFKVVTATAAIEAGVAELDSPVFAEIDSYTPPLTNNPLSNFGEGLCGGPLRDLIRRSCNAGTAQLAVELLGADALVGTAEDFGFGAVPPIELPRVEASIMPDDFGASLGQTVEIAPDLLSQLDRIPEVPLTDDMPSLAQAAVGQFEVKATPLQMALVAAAIANDGEVPNPHVVQTVVDSEGSVVHQADLDPWRRAMSQPTSLEMREAMIGVVESGTAQGLVLDGLTIGAKTGTAQIGASLEETHAWIIAFAGERVDRPSVAIAVIVEADESIGEQTGGRVAGPVALEVLEAWAAQR
ncbi:MAG: penicillin-binding transpeptidase domain-containing protein [Acidimicrobiia bacterium]|nr:penicillin-binding transpeptidase domain-containing protein [Acidimicrobiia bacterium]